MRSAIKSFLLLTWIVIICVFIGWFYARHRGLHSPIKPPLEHPFLKNLSAFSIIGYPPARSDFHFLERAAEQSPSVILWIDTRPRPKDGVLVLAREENETSEAPELTTVLERFPNHRFILSVRGHRPTLIPTLISIIEKANAADRMLIQSPEDGFLTELRKERPFWPFGTSLAQVTQLIMLSSVGLESLAPLRGDVLVIDNADALWRLNDRAIREATRRGLKIFAGPVNERERALELHRRGISGALVSDTGPMAELIHTDSTPPTHE